VRFFAAVWDFLRMPRSTGMDHRFPSLKLQTSNLKLRAQPARKEADRQGRGVPPRRPLNCQRTEAQSPLSHSSFELQTWNFKLHKTLNHPLRKIKKYLHNILILRNYLHSKPFGCAQS